MSTIHAIAYVDLCRSEQDRLFDVIMWDQRKANEQMVLESISSATAETAAIYTHMVFPPHLTATTTVNTASVAATSPRSPLVGRGDVMSSPSSRRRDRTRKRKKHDDEKQKRNESEEKAARRASRVLIASMKSWLDTDKTDDTDSSFHPSSPPHR